MRRVLQVASLISASAFLFPFPIVTAQLKPLGPEVKTTGDFNTALKAAREANKDKKFADAEAIILPVTTSQPKLVLPWIELGTAQIGLKKYAEAEKSFKTALGGGADSTPQQQPQGGGFFASGNTKGIVAPDATRASSFSDSKTESNAKTRTPEIEGVSYASLGEIYIRTGRVEEAEKAFDEAVKANPASAPLYRGNETIYFFQMGNADAQLAAADQAIAVDPQRAILYYFRAQAMVGKATLDPKTQKLKLPPGCAEAFRKYLALDPNGEFSADTKGILTAAGLPLK